MADRESSLEERERKDKEKADAIRERQERLGHVEPAKKKSTKKPKAEEKAEAEE
jgi:hypothetical protein